MWGGLQPRIVSVRILQVQVQECKVIKMQIKRVIAAGGALLLCLVQDAVAHVPRGGPARSDHHAFSRGVRHRDKDDVKGVYG